MNSLFSSYFSYEESKKHHKKESFAVWSQKQYKSDWCQSNIISIYSYRWDGTIKYIRNEIFSIATFEEIAISIQKDGSKNPCLW
jgi:hypothetical protein